MSAIADKLTTVAENMSKVYKSGQKSEYDRFWDDYQDYGNRTNYNYMFCGQGWGDETFRPKYDIKPQKAQYLFAGWKEVSEQNINVKERLEELGKVLDTSACIQFGYFLMYGCTQQLPVIDTRSADILSNFSVNSSIRSIDKIILRDDGSQIVNNMFASTHSGLTDFVIEGCIGKSASFQSCSALSVATGMSIINALKNYKGTDQEYVNKLSFTSKLWTNLNAAETPPNGNTWQDYVSELGWNYA